MRSSPPVRVLVVAGGDAPPEAGLAAVLPACDLVVAADSGLHHAQTLGVRVDLVIGDFDSVRDDAIDEVARAGAVLERFPVAKDKSDLELALDRARGMAGAGAHLVVVASVAGRLDHALANLLVLASPSYADCAIDAFVDRWRVRVLRDETRSFAIRPGATVTLLVIDTHAARVTTEGLRYPLDDEPVLRSSTRGVSNVAERDTVTVTVDGGVLFVLHEWAD
jgi:thiamine pyrophosphokinase